VLIYALNNSPGSRSSHIDLRAARRCCPGTACARL